VQIRGAKTFVDEWRQNPVVRKSINVFNAGFAAAHAAPWNVGVSARKIIA